MSTTTWRKQAACKGTPGELWFPTSEHPIHADQIAQAKAICSGCPVTAQCLDFILGMELPVGREGIFGGLTPDERTELCDPNPTAPATIVPIRLTQAPDHGLGEAA